MIHICFGVYDKDGRYSKFTGTTIHILHDNTMSLYNYEKFVYLAGKYGQQIKFYNVEKICADKMEEIKKLFPRVDIARFTVGAMYRLVIAKVLPANINKAIYLDSDMLVK